MAINYQKFRLAIVAFLVFPSLVFGQAITNDYSIYSDYLKIFQKSKDHQFNFVVRTSTEYGRRRGNSDIEELVDLYRNYVKGEKSSLSTMLSQYRFFMDTLRKDTSWIPLIARLSERMHKEHLIHNKFSNDLKVSMLTYNHYEEYFGDKQPEEAWDSFHEDYTDQSLLIDLSEIVNDDKHCVFYFSFRCGGLCGGGDLILYCKINSKWQYAGTLHIYSI